MIRIEHTEVSGWNAALRGMRNAKNSWDKADSYWTYIEDSETHQTAKFEFFMGENDLKLARTLAQAGDDHGKFLRMIHVSCDVVAPLYWWKEYSTYKVATTTNSCSTMHTIHSKEITMDDFSHEHLMTCPMFILHQTVDLLNECREQYVKTGEKWYWWQMIQSLPSSYNQRRTIDLNYQTLAHMYHARKNHKLDEWHTFCEWIEGLPYFKEMCIDD